MVKRGTAPHSVGLPQVTREDVQFGAILGHRTARDLDASGKQLVDEFLVGERL
jgi:hypothetical protein